MASRDVASEAVTAGVHGDWQQLKSLRQRLGLYPGDRTVSLPTRLAVRWGLDLSGSETSKAVKASVLGQRLALLFAELELSPERRAIGYLTWNIKPSVGEPLEFSPEVFGANLDWMLRIKRFIEREDEASQDEARMPLLPPKWRNNRKIREESDVLALDLLRMGPAPRQCERTPRPNTASLAAPSAASQASGDEALLAESIRQSQAYLDASDVEVDAVGVARLYELTVLLSRSYGTLTPSEVLAQALELHHKVLPLAQTRKSSLLADVQLIQGRIFGILSYASLDLGHPDDAYTHSLAVAQSALRAGHDDLLAWSFGTQAMILRFQERFGQSVAVANQGLELNVMGWARARLNAQNALGFSEMTKERETLASLSNAEHEITGTPGSGSELEDGIFLFPVAKLHYYSGSALMSLSDGHAREAIGHSTQAIERFGEGPVAERSFSDKLLAHVHLATAHMNVGELEAAPAALQPLFDAQVPFRTSWHVQWLDRLVANLRRQPRYANSAEAIALVEATVQFKTEMESSRKSGLADSAEIG